MHTPSVVYYTICGSFIVPDNAKKQLKALQKIGYSAAYIRNFNESEFYSLVIDSSSVESTMESLKIYTKQKGINCFVKAYSHGQ